MTERIGGGSRTTGRTPQTFRPADCLPPSYDPTTSEPPPNITNQEPAPSSFTPNLGRNLN